MKGLENVKSVVSPFEPQDLVDELIHPGADYVAATDGG